MGRLDWQAMMRVGIGQMRIPVSEFWQMTPAELMLVVNPRGSEIAPLGRNGFHALMVHFPDEEEEVNE